MQCLQECEDMPVAMSMFARLPTAISFVETKEEDLASPIAAADAFMAQSLSPQTVVVASTCTNSDSSATSPTMPSLESASPSLSTFAAAAMHVPTPIRPSPALRALCSSPRLASGAACASAWSPYFNAAALHALAVHVVQYMVRPCDPSVLIALHIAAELSWRVAPVLQAESSSVRASARSIACALVYLALGTVGPAERVACIRMFKRPARDVAWPLVDVDIPSQRTLSILETYCWRACGHTFPRGPPASSFAHPMTPELFHRIVFAICNFS